MSEELGCFLRTRAMADEWQIEEGGGRGERTEETPEKKPPEVPE